MFTPKAAKPPATYSQAVKTAGLVLANIRAILEAAGSSLEKVASVTVVLADEEDFPGMNEGMAQVVPFDLPARQGAKLPVRILGLKVSIGASLRPSPSIEQTSCSQLRWIPAAAEAVVSGF